MTLTLYQRLCANAAACPQATAIIGLQGDRLTYQRLLEQVNQTIEHLNQLGIGRQDRVALVLPNGPEMATAFLSIACAAACAPLNPAYRQSEFDFYLSDLEAKALIVQSGIPSPAARAAQERGIAVLELGPIPCRANGLFALHGSALDRTPTSARLSQKTSPYCCTPQAPPRAPSWFPSRSATW